MYMKENYNYYLKYTLLLIIPLLFIFPYGNFRCTHKKFKDPLESPLFWGLDGWSITHILLFMVLGYMYPDTFLLSMMVGITWELFEHFYGKQRPGWLGGYGDCYDVASDRADGNWWYGKWSDIICNATGFLIGQYVSIQ